MSRYTGRVAGTREGKDGRFLLSCLGSVNRGDVIPSRKYVIAGFFFLFYFTVRTKTRHVQREAMIRVVVVVVVLEKKGRERLWT